MVVFVAALPLDPLRVHDLFDLLSSSGRWCNVHLWVLFDFTLHLWFISNWLISCHQLHIIDTIMIWWWGWIRRGGRGGRCHWDVIGEHGHELLIIQPVEIIVPGLSGTLAFLHQWRFEEGDRISHRSPVRTSLRRREVKEFLHPWRFLSGVGSQVPHRGGSLVRIIRPVLGHVWDFRGQSAQRSRVRKLQYISELERSVTSLQVLCGIIQVLKNVKLPIWFELKLIFLHGISIVQQVHWKIIVLQLISSYLTLIVL